MAISCALGTDEEEVAPQRPKRLPKSRERLMKFRVNVLVCVVVVWALANLRLTFGHPAQQWLHFFVYLAAVLLSSGMKVAMPKSDGSMSVNFPFILLGVLQLSPLQAVGLATCSVLAQCKIGVIKPFTIVQVIFNVANVTTATVLAWLAYAALLRLHIEVALALAIAATVYFFSNTIPVALVIALSQRSSPIALWRQEFPWYLPFYLVGAALAIAANLISSSLGWMTSLLLIPMVYTIYRAYRAQMAVVEDRVQHAIETEALHLRTIEGLAMAIEAKDKSTHRHLMRVRVYVSEMGKLMKLDESLTKALLTASFLHDIGKLAVPEHIINKPGKLTHEEFEKMKIHPIVGADILKRVRFPYPVVPIVRSHHEAWDGSGYPDGLKGEDIPIGARILTVVDCFDALASERPYRNALPLDEAMTMVRSKAGIQFDPKVVALLEKHYLAFEELARKETDGIEPLNTDLTINRGAAPAAGFEPEHAEDSEVSQDQGPVDSADRHHHSFKLIAAASQEAKALFELSQMLGSSLGIRETSSMMFKSLQPLIPFSCFAVYLKSETSLVSQFVDGVCARAFSSACIPVGEGVSGWVAHSQRPIVNGNPTVEPNFLSESHLFTASSSALSIPLFDLAGDVFGVLSVYAARTAAFSKDHVRILQAIQSKFSLSLQNALRFRTAETDAKVDYLTKLPNMRHFFEQLDLEVVKASATGQALGVVVCDLNSFKAVNDRHGHLVGNLLLRTIADAFQECCRPGDTVARMGGDEFVFLFPSMQVQSAHDHLGMVDTAVHQACARLKIGIDVSTSIGVAFFPEDGETPEELLGIADRRMYSQKKNLYLIAADINIPLYFENAASH